MRLPYLAPMSLKDANVWSRGYMLPRHGYGGPARNEHLCTFFNLPVY